MILPVAHSRRRDLGIAFFLALLAALPYFVHGGLRQFIAFDDDRYVYANPHVTAGLTVDGIRWAFTTFHSANWHPLTWLSHMLDVTLFGLEPGGHHATSVLLHAMNAALVFLVLNALTGAAGRSAVVAALFGVHPLRVESVAWIAERKDVLAALFFFLVLLCYERHARRRGYRWYTAALILFALGLAAKPMLVTIPGILILLDVWPLGRTTWWVPGDERAPSSQLPWRTILVEKIPFTSLAVASSLVTFIAQRASGAVIDLERLTWGMRLANALNAAATYVSKTFWPAGLAVYYPYPQGVQSLWKVAAAIVFLAAATLLVLHQRRRRPYLSVGWAWFLGMLLPVIGLVQVGGQAMADRYTYLPSIGLCLALVWFADDAIKGRWRPRAAGAATVGILLALCLATATQVGYWRDSPTLFEHTIAATPPNAVINYGFGSFLAAAGNRVDALYHFQEAVRIRPGYAEARINLGATLTEMGRPGEALAHFREAIRLRPDDHLSYDNLGVALVALSRREEAVAAYREALLRRPDYAQAYFHLGISLSVLGRTEEALVAYRAAVRINPGDTRVYNNLGVLLASLGRNEEAIAVYVEALRRRPDYARCHFNLATAYAATGRRDEATHHFSEAHRLDRQTSPAPRSGLVTMP